MAIYRRGRIWWIAYHDQRRQRVFESSRSTNRAEAARLLAERQVDISRGQYRAPSDIGLREIAEKYMTYAKANKSSWDRDAGMVKHFLNRETGKPFRDLKAGFQRACRRAGISGVTWHTLRHTFASRLVSRGVDIVTVKELLGHSTVTVTMRYAHTNLASKREAVRSLAPTCDNLVTMPWRERRERKL